MCGLVAICSNQQKGFSNTEYAMFEHSMIFNQLRGDDSTGVALIDNDNVWEFVKEVGGFKALKGHLYYEDFKKSLLGEGRLVMGHGRAATRGNVTVNNAHPFMFEDKEKGTGLVFMHNGTLNTYQPGLEGMHKYSVDSEFLAAAIHKHGAEKALSEVEGAVACLWWDMKENTFNFYHNADRPLYYMVSKQGAFYLNSEQWILEYLNWKFKLGIPEKNLYAVAEMKWHSIKINDKKHIYNIVDIKKPDRPRYSGSYGYYGMYNVVDNDDPLITVTRPNGITIPSLCEENKEFWDRDIDTIEWINGDQHILYRNKTKTILKGVAPPKKGLLRMYESMQTGNRVSVFDVEGMEKPMYVFETIEQWAGDLSSVRFLDPTPEKKNPVLLTTQEDPEDEEGEVDEKNARSVPRIKNRIIRFHTKHPVTKKKVKHRGVLLKGAMAPHLEEYINTLDGHTIIGRTLNLELLYAEDKEITINGRRGIMVRVVCCEIKPTQDTYIDYEFYTTEKNKKEIEEIRYFTGVIGGLRLTTVAEQKISGACCLGSLHSIKFIGPEMENDVGCEVANEATIH